MTVSLTTEQQCAVNHVGNVHIDACPGSGKTRAVISKLLKCFREVEGTAHQVACLTYTNAGIDEVFSRLKRQFGRAEIEQSIELRTIHAFCLSKILRPYFWLQKDLRAGFQVLSLEDVRCREIVTKIANRHGLNEDVTRNFEYLKRNAKLPDGINKQAADDYWSELKAENLVDFDGVVHFSAKLCRAFPFISRGLASNFRFFVVDEFQDTTSDQLEILQSIAAHRLSTFFFVGDPNQSIMRFAGARHDAMDSFAACLADPTKFQFTANFRSSTPIVTHAEKLMPRTGGMNASGKHRGVSIAPEWWHGANIAKGIEERFIPAIREIGVSFDETAILAPNFYILAILAKALRLKGIPVVGYGSRPYRRSNHIVAPFFEELGQQVSNNQRNRFGIAQLRLAELVEFCGGDARRLASTFDGRVLLTKIYLAFQRNYLLLTSGEEFLVSLKDVLTEELEKAEVLTASSLKILRQAIDDLSKEISEHCNKAKVDFHVANIGFFGSVEESLRMLTIHKSKGREFEAVAVVMPHEGYIPYGKNVVQGSSDEADGQRLMYVAVTRAKRILMFFTDSSDWRSHSRYLGWMGLSKLTH